MCYKLRQEQLDARAMNLRAKYEETKRQLEENKSFLEDTRKQLDVKRKDVELLSDVFTKTKQLVEIISSDHINEIEKLVTSVLELVFFDRSYSFRIQVSEKREAKAAEFYIAEQINGEEYLTPLKTSRMSGGVISVVGFVLQVYFINFFGLSPLVFVDEGFAAISDEYLPRWFDFLRKIKDSMGFIIVLITHDERFIAEADRVYLVEDGNFALV